MRFICQRICKWDDRITLGDEERSGQLKAGLGNGSYASHETYVAIFVCRLFPTLTDNSRPLEGSLRLGKDQIVAKSDGGLQIMIARRDENGNETKEEVVYERAYYQLALEVTSPPPRKSLRSPNSPLSLSTPQIFFSYFSQSASSNVAKIHPTLLKSLKAHLLHPFSQDKFSLKCSLP